jgi:Ca2+:H+ antiporter
VVSLTLYGTFVFVQTVRHRDYFLPVPAAATDNSSDVHKQSPSTRHALGSLLLLIVSLFAVVGLAKTISPTIESGVSALGAPLSAVGVAIALLVLLPETLAAVRAATVNRLQMSFNLAYGSALASIGLTIPTIAVASIWLDGPLLLGLSGTEMTLLALYWPDRDPHRVPRHGHRARRRHPPDDFCGVPLHRGHAVKPKVSHSRRDGRPDGNQIRFRIM